ncbi:hypothetical protein [Kocuria palustris]|uniref:hypothetical protein n=1 Tax=Kocuria palustris TaxID=71999 RepID=UPI00077B84DD|nr:hypothetical protein [Kocuria palustris]
MSSGEIRQAIEVQAGALGPLLHAGMATSLAGALTRLKGFQHIKYPHLIPFVMRAELREYLESNPMANGWRVEGDPRKMGQIRFAHPGLNMEMQFLKERRRTYPGGVPPAGRNGTRRQRWLNDPLDLDLPNAAHPNSADPIRLLLLWDFLDASTLDQFKLRIVHPLEPGEYGKAVACDLILDVEDGGEIFKSLEFTGSPDDDDLFGEIDIDEEDESGT